MAKITPAAAEAAAAEAAAAEAAAAEAAAAEAAAAEAAAAASKFEAFCLRDSGFGKAGQVVTLSESDAKAGEQHGMLDLNKAAIAAAKTK